MSELSEQWILGWALGGAIVLVAASLLIAILLVARKIRRSAATALELVGEIRSATQPLWTLGDANRVTEDCVRAVRSIEAGTAKIAGPAGEQGGAT